LWYLINKSQAAYNMKCNIDHFQQTLQQFSIESLAVASGYSKRSDGKLGASKMLITFFAMMFSGSFSYRIWSMKFSNLLDVDVSFQAIAKRISRKSARFFELLLAKVLTQSAEKIHGISISKLFDSFGNVLVEDSTCVRMKDQLIKCFSGSRSNGKKKAQARIQVLVELKRCIVKAVELCKYSRNDVSYAANVVKHLQPGDLILRDLGYWDISVLQAIIDMEAFFLSRLKLNSLVNLMNVSDLKLVRLLRKADKNGIRSIDIEITVGAIKVKCRLVAIKLPPEIVAERIRKIRRRRNGKCRNLSPNFLYLQSWNLFITNVEEEVWSTAEVAQAYTVRWQIEIVFKCWKSKFKLAQLLRNCTGSDPDKPVILFHLFMIWMLLFFQPLFHFYQGQVAKHKRFLSPAKFATYLLETPEILDLDKYEKHMRNVIRFCCFDERKDRVCLMSLVHTVF